MSTSENSSDNGSKSLERDTSLSILSSLLIVAVDMFFTDTLAVIYIQWILATAVLFIFGRNFFINTFKQIPTGSPNMDTLVALSAGTAYLFSVFNSVKPAFLKRYDLEPLVYFESASVLIAFILLGKLFKQSVKTGSPPLQGGELLMIRNAEPSLPHLNPQSFEDKAAAAFFPIVFAIAILSMFTWAVLGGENKLLQEILAVIMVFIASCPCGLSLATSVPLLVLASEVKKNKIMFENAESIKTTQNISTVILDKAGIITEGEPRFREIAWKDDVDQAFVSSLIYSIEAKADHPIATALTAHLQSLNTENLALDAYEYLPGEGIYAEHGSKPYYLGSLNLIHANGISVDERLMRMADEWYYQGYTVIWFADKGNTLAAIALEDKTISSCSDAVKTLQSMGIDLYLLTGDHEITTRQVLRQAGIIDYKAQIHPVRRHGFIRELQKKGEQIAVVSNRFDAVANVSIALIRASAAIEIDLSSCSLSRVPESIRLSRKAIKIIRQNFYLAFSYSIIGIPIATGILHPVTGILLEPLWLGVAMAVSSICLVANSLRLKYI